MFDINNELEFTLNDGAGARDDTFVDGVLLANRHAFEYNFEYGDVDVLKKQFSLKFRVNTEITGIERRHIVFYIGDTGFRFECIGGQFYFILRDTEGEMLDTTYHTRHLPVTLYT